MRNVPNYLAMNGARDTVLQLEVHLGNSVFWEYRCVGDITNRSLENCISNPSFPIKLPSKDFLLTDSTMFLIVKRLIALSLGVHREQFEHRIGFTWPRPFLLRPLLDVSRVLHYCLVPN